MSNLIRLHKVNEISREEWLELRRRGIGGSDAATVVGLNPWSSRLALYANKKGLRKQGSSFHQWHNKGR